MTPAVIFLVCMEKQTIPRFKNETVEFIRITTKEMKTE